MEISKLNQNYTRFLDRNYVIVAHLIERLDELRERLQFHSFKNKISEVVELLEARSLDLDRLYKTLKTVPTFQTNLSLVAFLEDTFSQLNGKDDGSHFIGLADYLQIANALMAENALMMESFPSDLHSKFQMHELHNKTILESLIYALTQTGIESLEEK